MKKRFHNKIIIASVILVLVVSLAACGGKADSGATDDTSESNPPESSATVSEDKDSAVEASEDAKTDAEVDTKPVETQPETKPETKPESTQSTEKTAAKPTESHAEKHESHSETKPTGHTHNWVNHTATMPVWVSNIVPVYETQTVQVGVEKISDGIFWHCNCGDNVPMSDYKAHTKAHLEAGEPSNGYTEEHFHDGEPIYEERQVQVGTEDKGHYETQSYTDYVYCDKCGARQ